MILLCELQIEHELERTVALFAYISDKDVFSGLSCAALYKY
jgi:hypothetical protein